MHQLVTPLGESLIQVTSKTPYKLHGEKCSQD